MMTPTTLSTLYENPFAIGLFATTILAALLAYFRHIPAQLWELFLCQCTVKLTIKSDNPAFQWISNWLNDHPYMMGARNIQVYAYYPDDDEAPNTRKSIALSALLFDNKPTRRKYRRQPTVLLTPAPGAHLLWFKGRPIWLERTSTSKPVDGTAMSDDATKERESFTLRIIGRKQTLLRSIIEEAVAQSIPNSESEVQVVLACHGRWGRNIVQGARPAKTVILPDKTLEMLIADCTTFLDSRRWYADRGIPYRRGYLFHGVPGSGKTSTIIAIASELGLDVHQLALGDITIDDSTLNSLLTSAPPHSIVLIEDIDAAFLDNAPLVEELTPKSTSKKSKREAAGRITFSGLLNAIDGAAAPTGRLLFMTTNHKEKLDPALVRPGRADVHVEFDYATPAQAVRLFQHFFDNTTPEQAQTLVTNMGAAQLSMADLQNHFLAYRDNPQKASEMPINGHINSAN